MDMCFMLATVCLSDAVVQFYFYKNGDGTD
jgi:hypothetical protein